MKGIIITSDGCAPCKQVKEQFSDLLSSGEIQETNIDTNPEEAIALMQKYDVGIPSVLIVSDNGDLIVSI